MMSTQLEAIMQAVAIQCLRIGYARRRPERLAGDQDFTIGGLVKDAVICTIRPLTVS